MIETAAILLTPTTPEPSAPKRDDIPGFSFADAMGALTANAAQSLETHGGASRNAFVGSNTVETNDGAVGSARREGAPAGAGAPTHEPATKREAPTHLQTLQTNPQDTPRAAAAPLTIALQTAQTSSTPVAAQNSVHTIKGDAPTLRPAEIGRAQGLKAPKAPAPMQRPAAPTQEFAQLVAKRLESGATQFEMRLDPPSLGRIEANLRLADDGENLLVLKFENQSAMDLFANDEAALRNALSSSGFEFDGERLIFEHSGENTDTAGDGNEKNPGIYPEPTYDPKYAALWSSGAVDIQI